MSLIATAQQNLAELIVDEIPEILGEPIVELSPESEDHVEIVPLEHENHQHENHQHGFNVSPAEHHGHEDVIVEDEDFHHSGTLNIIEPETAVIVIAPEIDHPVPGAPKNVSEIIVDDEEEEEEKSKKDKDDSNDMDVNDARKSKKKEKWDWEKNGPEGFIDWVNDKLKNVPKHSGYDSAGLERAVAYLEKLDSDISKAMRLDLDGELDSNAVEKVREKIDSGLERLEERIELVKKKNKKKKKADVLNYSLVKEAGKAPNFNSMVVTVPLLTFKLARVCINGVVSGGHDLEDIFNQQSKKYKLTEREKAELSQLLEDMGYPLRQDRGYLVDEVVDQTNTDNFDWNANYQS